MVKAIIFDCFGVLTGDTWKEFVATLPKDQTGPAYNLIRQFDSGVLSPEEFNNQVLKLTGRVPKYIEGVGDLELHKNSLLLDYIRDLKKHYKTGLLSNVSTNWIRDTFLTRHEQALFDDILLSYEVGAVKPDPRIYELAAGRLGEVLKDCVFIDDSVGNCQGAEAVGIQAILYQNFVQMKTDLEKILEGG
ncbi:MAG TPA: HAD family phosphatase [Candidatus Saccharimonadales bacterium]|nr:HAD family phosphatase [Candidatus Saccharimonadales bacterium]